MRKIEFIKEWEKPSGIKVPKGNITGGRNFWLDEMIEKGFAVEYTGALAAGQNTKADKKKVKKINEKISKAVAQQKNKEE